MGSEAESLVLVIRVWRESSDQIRARVTYGTGPEAQSVLASSVASLMDTIRSLTESWMRGDAEG